jgi:hypothetical protein
MTPGADAPGLVSNGERPPALLSNIGVQEL